MVIDKYYNERRIKLTLNKGRYKTTLKYKVENDTFLKNFYRNIFSYVIERDHNKTETVFRVNCLLQFLSYLLSFFSSSDSSFFGSAGEYEPGLY